MRNRNTNYCCCGETLERELTTDTNAKDVEVGRPTVGAFREGKSYLPLIVEKKKEMFVALRSLSIVRLGGHGSAPQSIFFSLLLLLPHNAAQGLLQLLFFLHLRPATTRNAPARRALAGRASHGGGGEVAAGEGGLQ